jgi:VanZ family protein
MAAALAYAISDEWHQSFVPGRGATARDVAIDGIGIALAALAGTRTRLRELTA